MMHLLLRHFPAVRPGYWFAPKRYGFGAYPATWQGWVATAVFLALFGAALGRMPTRETKAIVGAALVIAFIAIAWLKTDGGWRWRWGGE